ncbi:MAG: hypothetical protein J0M12_00985 [Deltaproteobacteria bacterium]|nr:hypothetical protein [Deltaproteobacteria bacterium]
METMPARVSTVVELLSKLSESGCNSSFVFHNGALRCPETGARYGKEELEIQAIHRFEGESNPNDLTIVYVIRANDGTRGVFVDAFGPQGDAKASEFLQQVDDLRRGRAESQALAESPHVTHS